MTTYRFYNDCILVSFDDDSHVFTSNNQLKRVFSHLLSDFLLFSLTFPLPSSSRKYYYNVYKMIEKIQAVHLEHQTTIDMLRNLFSIVNHFNYPEFRIIFVNEI